MYLLLYIIICYITKINVDGLKRDVTLYQTKWIVLKICLFGPFQGGTIQAFFFFKPVHFSPDKPMRFFSRSRPSTPLLPVKAPKVMNGPLPSIPPLPVKAPQVMNGPLPSTPLLHDKAPVVCMVTTLHPLLVVNASKVCMVFFLSRLQRYAWSPSCQGS